MPEIYCSPEAENIFYSLDSTKLILTDASSVGQGKIEWTNSYSLRGSAKRWNSGGKRESRKYFREHAFNTEAALGITSFFDVGVVQGYSLLTDKENNVDETEGAADDAGLSLDETDGPHKGHGLTDLTVYANWIFYQSKDERFRLAYLPSVLIPTGRRSNLDHLGPSQGYVSMGNTLAATRDYRRWTFSANLGYEVPLASREKAAHSAGTLTAGAGAGYLLTRWFQPQAEVLYAHEFESEGTGSKTVSVALGAVLPLNDHLRFDLGLVQDFAGSGSDQTTNALLKIALLT